jgi:hypothetical protein
MAVRVTGPRADHRWVGCKFGPFRAVRVAGPHTSREAAPRVGGIASDVEARRPGYCNGPSSATRRPQWTVSILERRFPLSGSPGLASHRVVTIISCQTAPTSSVRNGTSTRRSNDLGARSTVPARHIFTDASGSEGDLDGCRTTITRAAMLRGREGLEGRSISLHARLTNTFPRLLFCFHAARYGD